jgi:hypothetical protein
VSQPEQVRLDSWKEIAGYLGRDLRTVRRWEKEKRLPVRRVPGGERSVVFAYPEEIDRWLQNGGAKLPEASHVIQGGQLASQVNIETQPTQGGVLARRLIVAGVALAVALVAGLAVSGRVENGTGTPVITSVTPVGPVPEQRIVIVGRGLGSYVAYANQDTPYVAIRDKTAGWAAGRIIPQNWDEVTLSVASWTDSEIVVTGFSGAYGTRGWKLSAGDEVEIAVWNPQTHAGPGTYRLHVSEESAP